MSNQKENTIDENINKETVEASKGKRTRKKKDPEKRKGYFYEREEEAFNTYLTSESYIERNRVFSSILYPAFTKMIESLIRRYELFVPGEDFEDTLHDTMSFLLMKIKNFDHSKGTKVYSYCGTVCKNYLLFKRTTAIKHLERTLSYETVFSCGETDERIDDFDEGVISSRDVFRERIIGKTKDKIELMLSQPEEHKLNDNDVNVGTALLSFLDCWEDHITNSKNKFNRFVFSYYMKEATLLNPSIIRKSMNKFKEIFSVIKHIEEQCEDYYD